MWIVEKPTLESIAARWKKQYYDEDVCNWGHFRHSIHGLLKGDQVYQMLLSLDTYGSTDMDNVDKAIGNKSWTSNICSECSEWKREPMVAFDVNGGGYEHHLCWNCLNKARHEIEVKQ